MINMVALMGRLTYEPELRTTPSGVSVLRFRLRATEIINAPVKTDRQILLIVLHGAKLRNLSADISTKAQ